MGALLVEGGDFHQINATFKHFGEHIEGLRESGVSAEKKLKKVQAGAAARMADAALVICWKMVETLPGFSKAPSISCKSFSTG